LRERIDLRDGHDLSDDVWWFRCRRIHARQHSCGQALDGGQFHAEDDPEFSALVPNPPAPIAAVTMASARGFDPSALVMAARTCLGLEVRPPTLALLPAATLPGAGLLLSALAHAGIICAVVMWLPQTLALPSMVATHPSVDMRHERDPEVLIFAALPPLDDAVASDSRPAHSEHPKRDFAGPRAFVSLLPDATNQ